MLKERFASSHKRFNVLNDTFEIKNTIGETIKLNQLEVTEVVMSRLVEILNFANVVNNAPVDGLDITIGANEAKNQFRKDEVKRFEDVDSLLANAPTQDQHMFKLPKVLN